MTFHLLYRASVYLSLLLASLILSIDRAQEDVTALLFPGLVAVASTLALLTVDRWPKLGISPALANPLGLIAVALAYLEYRSEPQSRLIVALGHLLIYLQLIKVFQVKRVEDDWYLLLLCLVEVVAGSYLGQSDLVGVLLLAWVLSALWVLMLGHLVRESFRAREQAGTAVTPLDRRGDPYAGLMDFPFGVEAVRIGTMTVLLGAFIFFLMPRRSDSKGDIRGLAPPRHLTGFTEEVRLGQLGDILENDAIVMTIEAYNGEGTKIEPPEDRLWRGITLANYSEKRWTRIRDDDDIGLPVSELPKPNTSDIRQIIHYYVKLEPTDNTILFSPRPVLKASAGGPARMEEPELRKLDGTLTRPYSGKGIYEYEVWSTESPTGRQPKVIDPTQFGYDRELLAIPPRLADLGSTDDLRSRLKAIALQILAESGSPKDATGKARAIETYLRDSKNFHYSLRLEPVDANIDPVEDFLINAKQGHCEYFASALALLLRSIDIHTRVVNGFKGGDWNGLAGTLTVRQKHAHSWVEALVGREEGGTPIWLELDPTPAGEREASVQKVGGMGSFRVFSDLVRYIWVFFIVGFNADRQQRLLYNPIADLFAKAKEGFGIMGEQLRALVAWLFHFPSVSSFFSIRGFFVSVAVMLALVVAGRGLIALIRRLLVRLRDGEALELGGPASAAFYRRALVLLAEAGLRRPPTETPREFARRAGLLLSAREGTGEGLGDVPPEVVDAYYALRFGGIEPGPDLLAHLNEKLDALEARLRGKDTA